MTHDDDGFEAFLEREARAYNAPPDEVPRDAMWAHISAARSTHEAGAPHAPLHTLLHAAPHAVRPSRRTVRLMPWIGMAATLLIGVGIGRYARQRGPEPTGFAGTSVEGVDGTIPATRIEPSSDAAPAVAEVEHTPAPRGQAVRFAADSRRAPERAPAVVGLPARRGGNSGTYSVASQQHLTRAEALVATVATMPRDAMMDSLTARWAKDVLTNTRLLLDSPAGDDPVRRRLLEDLETVLVQLVQRSGRADEDRDMLDRTLEKTQLLTRLRSGATGT